jgi:hypothetical protein
MMFKFFVLFGFFAVPLLASSQKVLEAYGDSLTAGFLADTNVTQAPSLPIISELISDLATYVITQDPTHIHRFEAKQLAWPSILAEKLARVTGIEMAVENYGVVRAESKNLMQQVSSAPLHSRERIAYFFMGHNDIVHTESYDQMVAAFLNAYRSALEEWDKRHEHSIAYLIPVGNIPRVFEVLRGYIWYGKEKSARYTCEDSWERFFPYARKLSQLHREGTLKKVFVPVLERMNEELERLGREVLSSHSSNRVRFVQYDKGIDFVPGYFAIDVTTFRNGGSSILPISFLIRCR